jgi:hypothetical protein
MSRYNDHPYHVTAKEDSAEMHRHRGHEHAIVVATPSSPPRPGSPSRPGSPVRPPSTARSHNALRGGGLRVTFEVRVSNGAPPPASGRRARSGLAAAPRRNARQLRAALGGGAAARAASGEPHLGRSRAHDAGRRWAPGNAAGRSPGHRALRRARAALPPRPARRGSRPRPAPPRTAPQPPAPQHVCYTVHHSARKGCKLQILKGVTGEFEPGQMCAIVSGRLDLGGGERGPPARDAP